MTFSSSCVGLFFKSVLIVFVSRDLWVSISFLYFLLESLFSMLLPLHLITFLLEYLLNCKEWTNDSSSIILLKKLIYSPISRKAFDFYLLFLLYICISKSTCCWCWVDIISSLSAVGELDPPFLRLGPPLPSATKGSNSPTCSRTQATVGIHRWKSVQSVSLIS